MLFYGRELSLWRMNKCKFASLIMLGAFVAGVASSSAVSAQSDKSLAKIVNEDSKSYGDSVDMNSKVSDEAASVADETNVNTEAASNEERKAISKDDSSVAKVDAKNLNVNIENKTDLPKNLPKGNGKEKNYTSVNETEKSEKNKAKKIKFAKGAAVVAGSTGAIGGATAVVSGLAKSFITGGSGSETGDTKPTYSPDTKSDDTSTELDNVYKSSDTGPTYSPGSESDDTSAELATDSKSDYTEPTYSPDTKSVDTSTELDNVYKSHRYWGPAYSPGSESDDTRAELATDSKYSNNEPTYSHDSEYDDTNTETDSDSKPNNLNQNEKSNNFKKAGIFTGTGVVVIILLLVYFAICRKLENKVKNKISEKRNFLRRSGAKQYDLFKNFENKLNVFLKSMGRNNIFALSRLNTLINKRYDFAGSLVYIIEGVKTENNLGFFYKISKIIKRLEYSALYNLCSNLDSTNVSNFVNFINLLEAHNGVDNFILFAAKLNDLNKFFLFLIGDKTNYYSHFGTDREALTALANIISNLDSDNARICFASFFTSLYNNCSNDLYKLWSIISLVNEFGFKKFLKKLSDAGEDKSAGLAKKVFDEDAYICTSEYFYSLVNDYFFSV